MRNASLITLLLTGTMLAGCSLAPDFAIPEMPVPEAYKEPLPDTGGELAKGKWKEAAGMEEADRGQWWKIFADPQLDALEDEAFMANQSLKAAAARVQQARAMADAIRPSYLPDVDIGFNPVRSKPSGAALAAFGNTGTPDIKPYNLYSGQGVLSYEADLFGSVRDNYKASLFESQAQEATYRSALLALQADVAQHYYSIRALDAERKLMRETVDIRAEAARIMKRRFEVGSAGEADYTRTQSELAGIRAELILLDSRRTQLEHALAVLLGKMPSDFTLAEAPLEAMPPLVPAGLPSDLLQRRPDISTAVSNMQAANKRIGVARTAFFPKLILTASGGYQSTELGELFNWSSRTWALGQTAGSAVAMSVFNSGRNFANLDVSKAAYEESVANYRQQVLQAFRDVEDNLNAQRQLAEQLGQLETSANAATRTTNLVSMRYEQGDVDYFQVVDAQRVSLSAQRSAVQTLGQRYLATVALVRALGGGWETSEAAATTQPAPDNAPVAATEPAVQKPVEVPAEAPVEPQAEAPKETPAADTDVVLQPEEAAVPQAQEEKPVEITPQLQAPQEQSGLQEQPKEAEVDTKNDDGKKQWWDVDLSFDLPAVQPASQSQKANAGTELATRPLEEKTAASSGELPSLPFDVKLETVPAAEALSKTSGSGAPMGTVLQTSGASGSNK